MYRILTTPQAGEKRPLTDDPSPPLDEGKKPAPSPGLSRKAKAKARAAAAAEAKAKADKDKPTRFDRKVGGNAVGIFVES